MVIEIWTGWTGWTACSSFRKKGVLGIAERGREACGVRITPPDRSDVGDRAGKDHCWGLGVTVKRSEITSGACNLRARHSLVLKNYNQYKLSGKYFTRLLIGPMRSIVAAEATLEGNGAGP